ncbi:MAG: phospholipase D family protein [Gemmataceae bacterium]
MSSRRWSNVSYLDAVRPDPGWRTDHAFLASYSADLVALVAAMLALAGLDDDRGSGSKVDFANAVEQLADKVRLITQAGRLSAPAKTPKILAILDRYVREVILDESISSWHPKAALTKQIADDGAGTQWRLWIGSRNLTRDLAWDVGLSLVGYPGGAGIDIEGIPELGHTLAQHAQLRGVSPAKVKSELRRVRWDAPSGCTIHSLQLLRQDSPRGLPPEPARVQKLVVMSPFLDGAVVGKLGTWGDAKTHRTLLSTRPELARLAIQKSEPLSGFHDLLFLDAPIPGEQPPGDEADASQDEEPEPRALHAKIIYAESAGARLVWTGSINATQRGWNGPNAEIVAKLEVSREVAAGLDDFIKTATTVRPDELGDPVETSPIDERLEEARKQVASNWSVTQQIDADGPTLTSKTDPNPTDQDVQFSIGLLGAVKVPWPRTTTSVRLPRISAGEATEFVCCQLTLADSAITWMQRAPLEPAPDDERDRQALARYLDPRTFLLWIRSLLVGDAAGDAPDWDDDDDTRPKASKPSKTAPTWWAPTIEEVLKAWIRDPAALVLIDRKVRHYLKLFQEQDDIEQTPGERSVVQEFHKTWSVLRRELVLEAT